MEVETRMGVNIAMASMMILVLFVMLFTCIWRKKSFSSTKPLIFLTSSIIFMLFVQIATWLLWTFVLYKQTALFEVNAMRVIYILNYISGYTVCIAIYFYIQAIIKDGYKQKGTNYTPKRTANIIMIAWGVLSSVLYCIIVFVPYVYRIENGVEIFDLSSYIILQIVTKIPLIYTLIILFSHKKALKIQEVILTTIFIGLASVFIVVDELIGLPISYVLLSIFVFILYVQIDLQRSLLLEQQEKNLIEWQTQVMLSQMQPHFLYNVLTTISCLCEKQNALEARDVVNRFSDYFRANLDSLGKEKTISFKKELEHIKTYLWLEKIRFENMLNIRYEIEVEDFMVPSLSVQPLVENAVKHGIRKKDAAGTVIIRTSEEELNYVIKIEDDGVGFDINEKKNDNRTHVGLENAKKRLEIISNGSLTVKSSIGIGTIATIKIPKGEIL